MLEDGRYGRVDVPVPGCRRSVWIECDRCAIDGLLVDIGQKRVAEMRDEPALPFLVIGVPLAEILSIASSLDIGDGGLDEGRTGRRLSLYGRGKATTFDFA